MKSGQLKLVDPAVMWKARRKPYDGQRQDLTRDEIDKLFGALIVAGAVEGCLARAPIIDC
jgi:hypothetical protein